MNSLPIPPSTPLKRLRLVLAWLLGAYLAKMYVEMGWVKFDPEGFWTAAFERWGYPVSLRYAVGVVEVVGGALLLVPWLASYAALSVGGVMIGAWITRAQDARWVDVAWISVYLAALLWIAFEWWAWRRPRFRKTVETRSSEVAS